MLRERRRRQAGSMPQRTRRAFAYQQIAQDHQSFFMRQRLEQLGGGTGMRTHLGGRQRVHGHQFSFLLNKAQAQNKRFTGKAQGALPDGLSAASNVSADGLDR